ncbi:MAG: cation transporter [Proteobacteria bacterium]|nr:cation transporter [Pseudomonadota bacterium]
MFIIELAGGLLSNSLALISDAGHMFTHIVALAISFIALKFAEKESSNKMTFGFHRVEILAALVNGATLFLLTIWIAYEAYQRFTAPSPINSLQMFWIAIMGLIVNISTAMILKGASKRSINIRSAFLHMLGDTLSSVGVIMAALIISIKGWLFVDPLISIMICIPIWIWSYNLILESVDVLLEATPRGIDIIKVKEALMDIESVGDVHEIHIWTLTSGTFAMSAHVGVADIHISETTSLLEEINKLLNKKFQIGHNTIQFECIDRCIVNYKCSLNNRSDV